MSQPTEKVPGWSWAIATVFGVGHAPKASGTAGALVALVPVALLASFRSGPTLLWLTLILTVVGALACTEIERGYGADPSVAVVDEVVGQWTALLFLPWPPVGSTAFWVALAAGFALFRLFDIWKPGPIDAVQRLPGGWGIMADDLLAGLAANLVLQLGLRFFPL